MELARSAKPHSPLRAAPPSSRHARGAATALALTLFAPLIGGCPSDPPIRAKDAVDSGDDWLGTNAAAVPTGPRRDQSPMPEDEPLDLGSLLPSLQRKGVVEASSHGARSYSAEILVNELAAAYPSVGPSRTLPEGALIVEVLRRAADLPPEGYLAMRKRGTGFYPAGGDWAYSAYDPERRPLEGAANSLCARCHAEAPSDWLFGLPRR